MSKILSIISIIILISALGFSVAMVVIPGKEIVIVNQKAQLASLSSFQSGIVQKNDYDKSSISIISKNIVPTYLQDFNKIKSNLLLSERKFIELDLGEMKARIYQDGKEIKEFPVLAKGNPQLWGGTPIGVYPIISKHEIAFSNLSKVYMPYAINFYAGRYYLHGQPYYPGGRLLQSQFSAGCIRFLNNDAKIIYDFVEEGTPILVIDKGFKNDNYKYPLKLNTSLPEISAKSYLIADLNNGFVLAEKNSSQKFPIASLTKLMMALVIAEHIDLKETILVTQEMIEPFESENWFIPKLEIGKRYQAVELFYPLLTESSNDVAEALSYFLGKEKTIQLMNEKTKTIGMVNTKFVEPTGLDKENISTTKDLFYLGRYILNVFPPLLKITKGEKVPGFRPVHFQNLRNKNVLFEHPNFIGGKTGYFEKYAGLFLLNLTTKNNQTRDISIIILDSDNLKGDLFKIFQWLKENYFNIENFETLEQAISTKPKLNSPPIASVSCEPSPDCGTINCSASYGCLFQFRNNSIDPDGKSDIVKSEWDILNWRSSPDISCEGLCNFTPQTAILSPGSYIVKLYVEDKKGASDEVLVNFILKESK